MQIIERLSRFIKSGFADFNTNSSSIFNSEDDELKRIIDELNSKDKKKENNNGYSEPSNNTTNKTELEKAFDTLGIGSTSDKDVIKMHYKKKMKEFHPDKVSQHSDDVRKRAETRAKEINVAYTLIRKHLVF